MEERNNTLIMRVPVDATGAICRAFRGHDTVPVDNAACMHLHARARALARLQGAWLSPGLKGIVAAGDVHLDIFKENGNAWVAPGSPTRSGIMSSSGFVRHCEEALSVSAFAWQSRVVWSPSDSPTPPAMIRSRNLR